MSSIYHLRKEYASGSLDETDVLDNPIDQFNLWMKQALDAQIPEPYAMNLATVSEGRPSSRIVLLRKSTNEGFSFFTNYNSLKGKQLAENPFAALNFFWHDLERQIRIEGKIEKLPAQDSDEYFTSRPKSSCIGAYASNQSEVIPSREFLEEKVEAFSQEFEQMEIIPRPDFWGGYILIPDLIEFWQGRESRLHDRIRYRKVEGAWIKERLSP